jgi:glucose-1-phosphate adenylyltransferase
MNGTVIGAGCSVDKAICAENSVIGEGTVLGEGEEVPNETRPDIYCGGMVTIGEDSVIPAGVRIGKNVMISGHTSEKDYPDGRLASGRTLQITSP